MATYHGIGVMSGTSLDGLDICLAQFTGDIDTDVWSYRIEKAITVPYTEMWKQRLRHATELSGVELVKLHVEYGHFIGQTIRVFIEQEKLKLDFVASHGHTVFHQPENAFTFQLGDGETTATYLKCPYVTNFRSKDLALGGQGAPLAPLGEKHLFSQTEICINLGGISNIGLRNGQGYDICPCNTVLNELARRHTVGLEYDEDGMIASTGVVKTDLLKQLDNLEFYKLKPPKSLGIEWISKNIFPLLQTGIYNIPDIMRTVVEHVSNMIRNACVEYSRQNKQDGEHCSVLITGGGALNKFLIKILTKKLSVHNIDIEETDEETVNYKEALIFAFLGLRSLIGLENVLSDITGSRTDTISGSIHRPVTSIIAEASTLEDEFHLLMKQNSFFTKLK